MRLALSAYFLLIAVGAVVFRLEASMPRGNRLSPERALFTAVNAATLTGFQQSIPTNDYREPGQWALMALTVGGTLISLIAGGIAVARVLRLPYSTGQIVRTALGVQLGAILIGLLVPLDRSDLFNSVFQAVSALGNSGLYLGKLPGMGSAKAYLVLLPLAVVGGLGLTVLMELAGRRPLSVHARTVLGWTAGIYLAGFVVMAGLQLAEGLEWKRALLSGSVAAVNSRTAGFPFESASYWPRTVQWVVMVLMVIGASPGGTGGGIKNTTFPTLLRGKPSGGIFQMAMLWVQIYAGLIFAGVGAMLFFQPDIPMDRLAFMAISAVSNVGLSHDPVALEQGGVATLCVLMFVGRVTPLFILFSLPEDELAVG